MKKPVKTPKVKAKKAKVAKEISIQNKINIQLGNLPKKLGILGNAVGNFDKIKRASSSTNRTFGSQTRYSTPQANYGAPYIRYVQAVPNMATVGIPRSDLAGTGVSDIEGISNGRDYVKQLTNRAEIEPVKKPSRMANRVPDNLKVYAPTRIDNPDIHADPRFSQPLTNKGELMRPRPATLAPTPLIPRLSSSSVGTFSQIGADPHAQAKGNFEALDRSDAYANPQRLDSDPWANPAYSGSHRHPSPTGSPSLPYGNQPVRQYGSDVLGVPRNPIREGVNKGEFSRSSSDPQPVREPGRPSVPRPVKKFIGEDGKEILRVRKPTIGESSSSVSSSVSSSASSTPNKFGS